MSNGLFWFCLAVRKSFMYDNGTCVVVIGLWLHHLANGSYIKGLLVGEILSYPPTVLVCVEMIYEAMLLMSNRTRQYGWSID